MSTLLEVRKLSVSFSGRTVVHDISFSIAAGEKLALVGESGSGKTVTALSLLRLAGDAVLGGEAWFDGRDLVSMPERALRGVRGQDIAMVFQEPMSALNPLMTVGAQIAEVVALKNGMTQKQAGLMAIKLMAETGILEPERRFHSYPHQLSGGQRQRAMIAAALACQPKLLLADEPTTALDVTLRGQILELLERLQKERGMAVLMITHDLNLVRKFAGRVIVMERGHVVEQGPTDEVFARPQHAYTRNLLASRPERDVVSVAPTHDTAQAVLSASSLRVSYPTPLPGIRGWFKHGEYVAVHNADFDLQAGQTLGVIGESGSGKTTLALAVLGLIPFQGQLSVSERQWKGVSAQDKTLRRSIQVVFQDPFSALSPRMTVEEIVGEGLDVHESKLTLLERRERVIAALLDVGLGKDGVVEMGHLLGRYPHEFSGGQRQRLAIARALIVQPQILVLDEPTSALDVTVQKQVLQLLQRLQREKALSFLLITHDVDVIRAMAHQVMVMKQGEVVEFGPVDAVLNRPNHSYTRILVNSAG